MTTGVVESKELLVALVRLGKLAAKQLGDGVDLSDAVAVAKAISIAIVIALAAASDAGYVSSYGIGFICFPRLLKPVGIN